MSDEEEIEARVARALIKACPGLRRDEYATMAKVAIEEVERVDAGHPEIIDPHPMQQVRMVGNVARFRENKIVRLLLEGGPFDLNKLALMEFSVEDRMQLAQLIGYSVSGFGDLPYAHPDIVSAADDEVEKIIGGK